MLRVDISFDEAHEVWFRKHVKSSAGDRRLLLERRSTNASGDEECAETRFLRDVWWPVYGELDSLIPEYEVVDGLGKTRYLDHAIVRYPVLADLEVDGYSAHQKDGSRWSFADDRRRDAGLRMLGWDVFRVAYSDVKDHPFACREMLRRWMEAVEPKKALKEQQMEEVTMLSMYQSPFTIGDVMRLLRISENPARAILKELVSKRVIAPAGKGDQRVRSYQICERYVKGRFSRFLKF